MWKYKKKHIIFILFVKTSHWNALKWHHLIIALTHSHLTFFVPQSLLPNLHSSQPLPKCHVTHTGVSAQLASQISPEWVEYLKDYIRSRLFIVNFIPFSHSCSNKCWFPAADLCVPPSSENWLWISTYLLVGSLRRPYVTTNQTNTVSPAFPFLHTFSRVTFEGALNVQAVFEKYSCCTWNWKSWLSLQHTGFCCRFLLEEMKSHLYRIKLLLSTQTEALLQERWICFAAEELVSYSP